MTSNPRTCGGCTACCDGWLTDKSLNLEPGSGCPNRTAEGCGIYETRPEKPCRSFTCAWLQRPDEFPEAFRPDQSGAICIVDRDWQQWKVLRAIPVGANIPPESHEWLLQYAKDRQIPYIYLERRMEGGRQVHLTEQALGPVQFAEDVKKAPGLNDTFWGFVQEE